MTGGSAEKPNYDCQLCDKRACHARVSVLVVRACKECQGNLASMTDVTHRNVALDKLPGVVHKELTQALCVRRSVATRLADGATAIARAMMLMLRRLARRMATRHANEACQADTK